MKSGVLLIGRQHSGNTVLRELFANHPDFFTLYGENSWFEFRGELEQINDRVEKIQQSTFRLLDQDKPLAEHVERLLIESDYDPSIDPIESLFQRSMDLATAKHGKESWVLQGTSYIFYAEEILKSIEDIKLIYLIRNPLDLVASNLKRKQRKGRKYRYKDWLYRVVFGWNKGVQQARRLAETHPDRFAMVKYEDVVASERAIEDLFSFLEIEYSPELCKVGHINRSDGRRGGDLAEKGLITDRIDYYRDVLSPSQIHAARSLLCTEAVQAFYPQLLDSDQPTVMNRVASGGHKVICMGHVLSRLATDLSSSPRLTVERLWKRIRA